ncbi:AbrB family transcriptional regulator [Sneathiella glossodoripedis]|uniref:AbrB family transcriptional regulator n=1 Tax=Sneathiella glossodoripedis TaxID=418853 RepID=UPI000471DC98|nr:AbrB family transcriptional regulator [Sneathiella glossodoripedis]
MTATFKALFIGSIGGGLFFLADLPLAWMMGSMCITTVLAVRGAELAVNATLRKIMTAVLGVMLGSSFSSETIDQLSTWSGGLILLAICVILSMTMVYFYFRKIGHFDRATAYFSAAPGGFNVMYEVGEAKGGDGRTIALIHATRILLLVMTVPLAFRFAISLPATDQSIPLLGNIQYMENYGLLLVAGIFGYFAGGLLRFPAYHLMGPMLIAGVLSITGVVEVMPPMLLIYLAQLVIGTAIGLRFLGTTVYEIRRVILLSCGSTSIMILLACGLSFIASDLVQISIQGLILALSPGGLAEMSLVALGLGIDVAFVSIMHVIRIAFVIACIPFAFSFFEKIRRK